MSNLVFVSGDFCSGSTLMFTLFRKSEQYYSLYEPLHEDLRETLIWRPKPDERSHHFFVEDYHTELAGFEKIADLHDRRWGSGQFFLAPETEDEALYRYIVYLIGTAFGRAPRVMFKENRLAFRLAWLRTRFPQAKFVHIYRDKESQWKSVVRRVQETLGKEDVGQNELSFNGFSIATFCEDLKSTFPELDAGNFKTGYDRFCALWELSYEYNRRSADISVEYRNLTRNFEETWSAIWKCVGGPPIDVSSLKQYVVPPERQKEVLKDQSALRKQAKSFFDKWGFKYASARLRARAKSK